MSIYKINDILNVVIRSVFFIKVSGEFCTMDTDPYLIYFTVFDYVCDSYLTLMDTYRNSKTMKFTSINTK